MDADERSRESRLSAALAAFGAPDEALAARLRGRDAARFAPPTRSRRHDFAQAMRLLEAAYGADIEGCDPDALPWRLHQPARDGHVDGQLGDVRVGADGRPTLECHFFGLLGPEGPLPDHVTELVREHELDARAAGRDEAGPLPDFIGLLNHRMLLLFHRVWKSARPMVQRGAGHDHFAAALDALAGQPFAHDGPWRLARRDACLHFAGGHVRAEGLVALVTRALGGPGAGVRCRVRQNVPHWRRTPAPVRAGLGTEASPALGRGALLGPVRAEARHGIVIELGLDDVERRASLLPGTTGLGELRALLREYLQHDFRAALHLRLARAPIRDHARTGAGRLGAGARLGRDAWLGGTPSGTDGDADDAADDRADDRTDDVVAVPLLH